MSKKDISEINIIYKIKGENRINIFGGNFVENNKNNCKMIIDKKEYKLTVEYENYSYNNTLRIKFQ